MHLNLKAMNSGANKNVVFRKQGIVMPTKIIEFTVYVFVSFDHLKSDQANACGKKTFKDNNTGRHESLTSLICFS